MKDFEALKKRIAEYVTLGDLLAKDGKLSGTLSEEQYSCTFHGRDLKKSARYYRNTDSSYCWVCKKSWDIFSYVQQRESMSFKQAVEYLLKTYAIPVTDLPDAIRESQKRRVESSNVKANGERVSLEKLCTAIKILRGSIPDERYERLIFGYMLLRHATADDKKSEGMEMLRRTVLRIVKETRDGR